MKTTTATVRIRLDQAIEVEKRGMNLSEFIRDKLDQEFGSNDFMKTKEKELKEQLQKLKQIKKETQATNKIANQEEEKFIAETKEILVRDPTFLEGRWRKYMNDFRKTISIMKFREMFKEVLE